MPRFPRTFLQTSFLHVITQGLNKNYIFNDEQDIKYYISLMSAEKKLYNIKIIAYCVMNSHAHLLLQVDTIKSLSSFMHKINTKFACYYNKKYNKVGHVFRNRFKSEGIYSEHHLYSCVNYIFNNPVKAGICTQPQNYAFSNYSAYHSKYNDICTNTSSEYEFIDIDSENMDIKCQKIITDFLHNKSISIAEIFANSQYFDELLVLLDNNHISLRKMEQHLHFCRKKIKQILSEIYN